MKYKLSWFHWNGLFGDEEYFSFGEAHNAANIYEKDGCRVLIEEVK